MATPRLSLHTFSDVVGAIYDCALDPERWHATLLLVSELMASPYGGLAIHDYAHDRTGRLFDYGYDDTFMTSYFEKFERMNPVIGALRSLPVGDVATTMMLIDEREFTGSQFFHECLKPSHLYDGIFAVTLRSAARIAILFGNRRDDQPCYGEAEVRLFRLLVPHVCRALAISDALDLRTLQSEALAATLDTLTVGVFLLDRAGRIVHMNRAAEQQIKGNALGIVNHRLAPADPGAQKQMARALATATEAGIVDTLGGHAIALPDRDAPGYVANVLPIDRGERRAVLAPFAAATAVFVQDPAVAPPLPGEAFAKLHGLTAGELRFLLALAPGLTIRQAADVVGITEATAKSHLQSIFAKTGTARQTELLRLLATTTPPVQPS